MGEVYSLLRNSWNTGQVLKARGIFFYSNVGILVSPLPGVLSGGLRSG